MRALTAALRLVAPPLSNQEADRLRHQKGVYGELARARLGEAKIYMIGQRAEIFFDEFRFNEESGRLDLVLVLGERRVLASINALSLSNMFGRSYISGMGISASSKYIHVLDVGADDTPNPVWGVSPDALLFHIWRRDPDVWIKGDGRSLASYRLLYIGMSEDGAYQRLINAPHHARLDILTNELQVRAEARVSDEIFFFLFEIDPLQMHSWGPEDELTDEHVAWMLDPELGLPPANLISDVEKAFISMLETPYNKRRYKNYPKVAGGIADKGFDSYAYAIAEDLSFDVHGQRVDGGYAPGLPSSNSADFILVSGKEVQLIDISEAIEVDYG
jgi:hypothetical protein